MKAVVRPTNISGNISAIGSKSYAHRALIAAALLCRGETEIHGITPSADVQATVGCLRQLGAKIEEGEVFFVTPAEKIPQRAVFDCLESGSTLRFFLPIAAALGVESIFCGAQRLLERPIAPLLETLESGGVVVNNWHLSGKLRAGDYTVSANVSSQFVTGMLFALSLLEGTSRLFVQGEAVSKEYVAITADVLKSFGVQAEETSFGYTVFGGHKQPSPVSYTVEGDWSNAAFWLVGGALCGDLSVGGLNCLSRQGDRAILNVLKQAGAQMCEKEGCVHVKRSNLKAFDVDAQQIPDLVPVMSVLAANAVGTSEIFGVERLKWKESDRLEGVLQMLKTAGICATSDGKILKITGGTPCCGKYFSVNDHRMAMSQAILSLCADAPSEIFGADCVKKSYPKFFEELNLLGGGNCVSLEG